MRVEESSLLSVRERQRGEREREGGERREGEIVRVRETEKERDIEGGEGDEGEREL